MDVGRYSRHHEGWDFERSNAVYGELAALLGGEAAAIGSTTAIELLGGAEFTHTGPITSTTETHHAPRKAEQLMVVFDSAGRTQYPTTEATGMDFLAVVGPHVSERYLEHLRDAGVSCVFAGQDGRDIAAALQTLSEDFGVTRLTLMGGSTINGVFLRDGLLDELSILLYPGGRTSERAGNHRCSR
ncbi:riboflavin biosynthesis pyrimidine reductase [Kibdelosporangium banguiense]|uniref:Riboflavin biosynthesis pyrimidine reductase n=1 Tax=Kibdelosporangium banguiense TaxID=1365924 RepID=A0ABS4TYI1_9PSEU|nr:riboflavin biosynthesis pyrimidine reductase [Kibdelosporangium banguiense]